MKPISRRNFVVHAGAAVVGAASGLSPAGLALAKETRPRPRRLRVFSIAQAKTYSAWCDVLAIGAARAGVAFFADTYLAEPYPESLLMIRYLQNPPYTDFYTGGIAGVDQESRARFAKPFVALDGKQKTAVVEAAVNSSTEAWTEPNPNFFYFVSRSDAVDVVYGTMAGFRDLRIPYMAHIQPKRPW